MFIEVRKQNYEKLSQILKTSSSNFNTEYNKKLVGKSSNNFFKKFDILVFEDSIFQNPSTEKIIKVLNLVRTHPSILLLDNEPSISYKDIVQLGFLDSVSINSLTERVFSNLIIEIVKKSEIQKSSKERKRELERKIRESTQKIQESERKFKIIFNNTNDAIFIHDLEGNFLEVNQTACEKLGYSKREFLKLRPQDIDSPKYSKMVLERIKGLLKSGETFFETEHITKEGEHIPIELSSKIIEYDGSKAILSIARDITERKQKEEDLKKSKREYENLFNEMELIFDHIPALLFYKDKKNNYIRVNQYLADAHNMRKEDLEGKNLLEFYLEEEANAYWEDDLQVINSGEPKLFIEEKWKTDEGEKWVNTSKIPFRNEDDEIIGIIGFSIDMTAQKITEEKLRESEKRYRTLIEDSPYSIILIDDQKRVVECNPATEELTGYKKEELLNQKFIELNLFFDNENYKKLLNRYKKLIQGIETEPTEIKIKKKSGEIIWVRIKANYVMKEGGNFMQVMIHDITKRKNTELLEEDFKKELEKEVKIRTKKLNEALEQKKQYIDEIIKASHFKDEFLATMSHELRTPLNAIIGFTDLLLEGSFGELNEQQIEYLEDIKDSAQHQFDMIGGILDISKIESGRLILDNKTFSLNSIVDQIQSTLIPMYKKKDLDFRIEGLEEEIEIYADPIRIKQILYNLLSNAIKFTIEGYCKLTVKEKYDRWIFKVKDTGIGIAKSDYDLIFKEFERVESSYVRSISGTGLGLSLTKRLVELHNGEISFTSVLGVGSTFKFYIPKKSEDDIL